PTGPPPPSPSWRSPCCSSGNSRSRCWSAWAPPPASPCTGPGEHSEVAHEVDHPRPTQDRPDRLPLADQTVHRPRRPDPVRPRRPLRLVPPPPRGRRVSDRILLFVCAHGAARSRVAAAWFNANPRDGWHATTAAGNNLPMHSTPPSSPCSPEHPRTLTSTRA